MGYLKEIVSSRELLLNLTLREVKGKYKRTVLGQLWSLANPLASMLIYTFVFGFIFRSNPDPGNPSGLDVFALWLLCGLLPWTFFSGAVSQGMGSLVANANLIQKVYFPRTVLPISIVLASAYNWLFEMGVLVVVLSVVGSFVIPWLPLVVLTMLLLAVFASGVALLLSIANVHFRDTQNFVQIGLQVWMYLTPIIYPIRLVQEFSDRLGGLMGTTITLTDIYRLNPMEQFVDVFRQLLYDNRWPDVGSFIACAVWAFVALALGGMVFRRNERKLAELL
jgi:lipopolysaccharide transport system permease protein